MKRKALGTYEVAKICHVTPATVGNWIGKGLLPTFSTGGGHRRIWSEDLITFLKKHNIPLSKELENEAKYKVLVVDDEQGIVALIERILRAKYRDMEIFSAGDGFEAGQKVEMNKPNLIILDIRLPGINGFEVCRNIKSQESLKHTKVLAMSGNNTPEFSDRALAAGADDFLPKPFSPQELIEKLEALMVTAK